MPLHETWTYCLTRRNNKGITTAQIETPPEQILPQAIGLLENYPWHLVLAHAPAQTCIPADQEQSQAEHAQSGGFGNNGAGGS